ncbi:MAG: phosphatase PAP2 family protein [Microthrixaceae bacterium]
MSPRRVQALRMLLLSVLSALLFGGLYLLFVRTVPGQRFDDIAFEGRKATRLAVRRPITFVLHFLTVPSIVLGCAIIAVDTVRRKQWSTCVAALGSIALTIFLARFLKVELARPELVDPAYANSRNSFPSGHTAAVMAVLLAAISACEQWVRPALAAVSGCAIAVVTAALLGSGWHRPSDVLAGLCLAVVIVGLSTSLRLCLVQEPICSDRSSSLLDKLGLPKSLNGLLPVWAVALVAINAVALLALIRNPSANPSHSLLSYMVVVVVCCSLGMSAVFTFAQILTPFQVLSEQETESERAYQ